MKLFSTLRSLFGRNDPPSAPRLRNRPGEMAWVKPYGHDYGANVLAGQAVKTVRLIESALWEIEPRLDHVVTAHIRGGNGVSARPGDCVTVLAISDECLEPWKEDGVSDSEVRDLYAPKQTEIA